MISPLRAEPKSGLRRMLPGRMPCVDFDNHNELQEVNSMLAESVIEWTTEWEQQGFEKSMRLAKSQLPTMSDILYSADPKGTTYLLLPF
jgi:hypothetical protein